MILCDLQATRQAATLAGLANCTGCTFTHPPLLFTGEASHVGHKLSTAGQCTSVQDKHMTCQHHRGLRLAIAWAFCMLLPLALTNL